MLDAAKNSDSLSPRRAAAPTRPAGRVLVTGGSGFLGHHLVALLAGQGHLVRVFDVVPPSVLLEGVEYVRGSVVDRTAVMQALDGITCVYHLAGIAHMWTADMRDFDIVNRIGSEVVLAVARKFPGLRIVHCSSETVLFPRRNIPVVIDETVAVDLADMAGPYSRSKYLAERAALKAATEGLDVVVVNPTIPIGSGDRNFMPPTAMLARFLRGARFFLNCTMNVVDCRDVATGMMLAAECGRAGERYILGGENIRLDRLLEKLAAISGRSHTKISVPPAVALAAGFASGWIADLTRRRPAATVEGVRVALRAVPFDIGKARRELNYAPHPIDAALADAVRWLLGGDQPPSADVGVDASAAPRSPPSTCWRHRS
jgi:dihydroflavonol-4-reductase